MSACADIRGERFRDAEDPLEFGNNGANLSRGHGLVVAVTRRLGAICYARRGSQAVGVLDHGRSQARSSIRPE